jgi:DNA-binding transcriptional ArsR family regulator
MVTPVELTFRALADPTRRALFERLCRHGEHTVARLTQSAGVSQPAVSKHLRLLKDAKLVRARAAGRETHYSAAPAGLKPLINWFDLYARFWPERLDGLARLLDRMEP